MLLSDNYILSKNYKNLFQLVEKQDVICVVQPYLNEECDREVLVRASKENNLITVGTIGIEYFRVKTKEDFEKMCVKYNLSFIQPKDFYLVIDFENDIWECKTLEQAKQETSRYSSSGKVNVYEVRQLNQEEYE